MSFLPNPSISFFNVTSFSDLRSISFFVGPWRKILSRSRMKNMKRNWKKNLFVVRRVTVRKSRSVNIRDFDLFFTVENDASVSLDPAVLLSDKSNDEKYLRCSRSCFCFGLFSTSSWQCRSETRFYPQSFF